MTPSGGARKGAGRKPLSGPGGECTQPRTVTLLPRHWDAALAAGDGENASLGVRRALDAYRPEEKRCGLETYAEYWG